MEFSSVQNLLGRVPNIVFFPLFSDKQEITASISLMVKDTVIIKQQYILITGRDITFMDNPGSFHL